VLDRVGHVQDRPVDVGLLQGLVEHLAGGPDEGTPGPILLVAGLLADQHEPGRRRALPEDGLGAASPQVTGLACRGRDPDLVQGVGHGLSATRRRAAGKPSAER